MEKTSTENKGERLRKLLIDKYGKHGNSPKLQPFIKKLNEITGYFPNKNGKERNYISASALSNICKGKKGFTNEHAIVFAKALDVNADYLLCLSDFPTEIERIEAEKAALLLKHEHEWSISDAILQIVLDSVTRSGYSVKMCAPDRMPNGIKFKNKYAYYLINGGNRPIIINIDDYSRLVNDILDYSEYKINKMIKEAEKNRVKH